MQSKIDLKPNKFFFLILPILLIRLLIKILCQGGWRYRLKPTDWKEKTKYLFAIGNGPSIKPQLEKYAAEISKYDCICVNHFADSDFFGQVKPRFYLVIDPYFFAEDSHEDYRAKVDKTYRCLNEKVSWNMTLFVPSRKAKEFLKSKISNSKISTCIYNSTGISHRFEPFVFPFFKWNLASLVGHNVLVSAIYIGLVIGYKNVIVLGGDYSWLESMSVDQDNNLLCSTKAHFYGSETEPWYSSYRKDQISRVDSVLYLLSLSFRGHVLLNSFAIYMGSEVKNASAYSWVDAYKRISLQEILAISKI